MSRSVPYRRDISEACNWHQTQALDPETSIFILSQTGPTGFLLKEEGETKNFKVFLGDIHNCTCPVFKKEKDLCKHICWLLLKKFRLPRTDSMTWQLGLCEREINQVIKFEIAAQQQQRQQAFNSRNLAKKNESNTANPTEIEQRPITEEDVCPICQDELLIKKLPVTHCRFGCGNNVHIKCMKVWADHQKTQNTNGEPKLTCPLCREIFGTFELLDQEYRNNSLFKAEKQDLHYGISCKICHASPISGKCYKCTSCPEYYLCQPCFNTDAHKDHSFVFREKINQKFHKASREHVGDLPKAVAEQLANRDLTDADYELLLQLEHRLNANKNGTAVYSQIPEKVIKSWQSEKVRENSFLLGPGYQCRVCLRNYKLNEMVRKLPGCKHRFHLDCIDNWLLHSHPTCPIDGQVVWDPISDQIEKEEKRLKQMEEQQQKQQLLNFQQNPLRINSNDIGSLGLIINYKQVVVENKPTKNSKVETLNTMQLKNKIAQNNQQINKLSIGIVGNSPMVNKSPLNISSTMTVRTNNLCAMHDQQAQICRNANQSIDLQISSSNVANVTTSTINNINSINSININNNASNLEDNARLLNRKTIKGSLLKGQKSTNVMNQNKKPTIEIKGNQVSDNRNLRSDESSSSQISNYSNKNRTHFLKTATPQKSVNSMTNLSDGLSIRRKLSLGDSRGNLLMKTSNGILNTTANYQLTKHKKPVKTSDFEKDTYDSVDIVQENETINNLSNTQIETQVGDPIDAIGTTFRESLIYQNNIDTDQAPNVHLFKSSNSSLENTIAQLSQTYLVRSSHSFNPVDNNSMNYNNDCTNNNIDSTTNNTIDSDSHTNNSVINQRDNILLNTKNLDFDLRTLNSASSKTTSDLKKTQRPKVNFDKKTSNPNPNIEDLTLNLPMAVGIQPIFVNSDFNRARCSKDD